MLRARILPLLIVFLGLALPVQAQVFTISVEDRTAVFDQETGAGANIVTTVSISEDPDGDGYPNGTFGFSLGLACDPEYLEPLVGVTVGDVHELNDGDGPTFEVIAIAEGGEGFIVGIVYSLFEDVPLLLDGPVLQFTFALVEDNLVNVDEEILTDLEFSNELNPEPLSGGNEPPPVDTVIVVGGTSLTPGFSDAQIRLLPSDDEGLFLRGDANGDGVVFAIIDALYLLSYGFTLGSTPPCMDAADSDDNGTVFPILDALYLLQWGFTNGPEPSDPGTEECGVDDTDDDDVDCLLSGDGCL